MGKKMLLGTLFIAFITTNCNKNGGSAPVSITGTWSLSSFTITNNTTGAITAYLASEYPCIVSNQLVVNADGTAKQEFTSADTCFLVQGGNYAQTFGIPGTVTPGTWTQNNGAFTFRFTFSNTNIDTSHAITAMTGSVQDLIFTDTLKASNSIAVTVYEK